jgi:large subunit ribosomal protein L7/L12
MSQVLLKIENSDYNNFYYFMGLRNTTAIRSSTQLSTRLMSQAAPAQEKLQRIVSDISQLTLIEVAELNKLLKTTLNIPDAPVMAYGAAPAAPSAVKEVC